MELKDLTKGFFGEQNDSIKIDLEKVEEVLVVKLTGYIDTYNSDFFMKQMDKVLESGFYKIAFDCAGVSYISSTGIGSLTAILRTVKTHEGELVLFNVVPKVREIFSLLGFSQFFRIVDNLEDAITFLNASSESGFTDVHKEKCPSCEKPLIIKKPGRFRCPGCKSIVIVNSSKQIFLG